MSDSLSYPLVPKWKTPGLLTVTGATCKRIWLPELPMGGELPRGARQRNCSVRNKPTVKTLKTRGGEGVTTASFNFPNIPSYSMVLQSNSILHKSKLSLGEGVYLRGRED